MKKLICLLCMFLLVSCSTTKNIEPQETSTAEPQETVAITTSEPTEDTSIDYDPYDVKLIHDPMECLSHTLNIHKISEKIYYSMVRFEGTINYFGLGIYDFNNFTIENRYYYVADGVFNYTQEEIENNEYTTLAIMNLKELTIDTYKDDVLHTQTATCHLDYENETWDPATEECKLEYSYNKNRFEYLIADMILSYGFHEGDEYLALSNALRKDENNELLKKYINEIIKYYGG